MLSTVIHVLLFATWAVGLVAMLAALNYHLALYTNRSAKATYAVIALLPFPWYLLDDMLTEVGIQKRSRLWKSLGVAGACIVGFVVLIGLRTLLKAN